MSIIFKVVLYPTIYLIQSNLSSFAVLDSQVNKSRVGKWRFVRNAAVFIRMFFEIGRLQETFFNRGERNAKSIATDSAVFCFVG